MPRAPDSSLAQHPKFVLSFYGYVAVSDEKMLTSTRDLWADVEVLLDHTGQVQACLTRS